ncbi:hypothetical protein CH63R_06229 [Colletotrichum higginsianum IMI 349063]|uniref:Uncharacterized protein n=1 Tax=Colletotrichum higginsianum (strain IMI 349063) TaxID=759273 RepID=A0A1B7YEL2_COLHI|nr:hypothetical protein CH63R_06229 [Colletotrichum higginsianum IMI 349063]OBR10537.1 hypothetical protein CH63R_06229 [Colletotrichum higginsianum IMI 349063]
MDIFSTSTFVETPTIPQITLADYQGIENTGRSDQTAVLDTAARATPSTSMIQEHDPGIPIPLHRRTRKKIWPRLTFPTAYYSRRFEVVIEHFKKAVDKHDRLQDVAHNINYHPARVGPTPEEAKPSILVLCRQEDTSDLVSLFDSELLARIQCASHSRLRLPSVISGTRTRTGITLPDFWVYYYPSATNPTTRNAASDIEFSDVHLSSSITFCGALVEYNGRKATIGLTIEIDGMSRLLTVEHLFDEALPRTDKISPGVDEAIWLYESDDSEDSCEESDNFGKGYNKPLSQIHSMIPDIPNEFLLNTSAAELLHPSIGDLAAEQPAERDSEFLKAMTAREPLACKANESKILLNQVKRFPT